jgi:ABC-type nickel/cobalt efflux system permease component RcnA
LKSILFLGVLMGMRHALEADHLAAVASLATRTRSLRAALLQGTAWGLGHTLTLFLFGGVFLLLGAAVPESWARGLESAVGLMLIFLGGQVLWRIRRRRIHLHVHGHGDGRVHLHAHRHEAHETHDGSHHEHSHDGAFPMRAVAVGMVHGLAGSAALLLLTVLSVGSPWQGLAYIALFGVGSILGMAVLGSVIAVPLQASARRLGRFHVGLEAVVGLATIVIGARMLYELSRFASPR